MKQLLAAGLLLLAIGTACEKDKGALAQRAIVGTWKIDKIVNGNQIIRNAGEITYTKKKSDLQTSYNVTQELYLAEATINGQTTTFTYELFEGSPDLVLNHFDSSGRPSGVGIEMFTKDMLIYYPYLQGTSVKYYLSK